MLIRLLCAGFGMGGGGMCARINVNRKRMNVNECCALCTS
jgi:hypothetical protein